MFHHASSARDSKRAAHLPSHQHHHHPHHQHHYSLAMLLPRLFYRFRLKFLLLAALAVFILEYMGAFTHMRERPFSAADFEWPLHGDVQLLADRKRHGERTHAAGADEQPINVYNHTFLRPCAQKCRTGDGGLLSVRLVFVVKSALRNFGRRQAIRNSWGFERRLSDVLVRTVFVLGTPAAEEKEPQALQHMLDVEAEQYGDLVQADFGDSYFNNTIKTMTGFRWAMQHCSRSQFYMFVDDDYYVSTKNVLRFVRNPVNYPEYLEEADETLRKLARRLSQSDQPANETALREAQSVLAANEAASSMTNRRYVKQIQRVVEEGRSRRAREEKERAEKNLRPAAAVATQRKLMEFELAENARLFSGFVFSSAPHRHRTSKWYVSLDEYPWHLWPPYVTAGAFILSREAFVQMYYVSMFTKHFR